ncbi:EF-hand_domain pair [Hexamita inflata]|uniref:EF-hand domain pair n=1 Tax=Hexamita inflata TaxID=28002 RepID=A0AA86UPB3_9EUKA|nr:EF-hand domain pair [Hexamita inflata]
MNKEELIEVQTAFRAFADKQNMIKSQLVHQLLLALGRPAPKTEIDQQSSAFGQLLTFDQFLTIYNLHGSDLSEELTRSLQPLVTESGIHIAQIRAVVTRFKINLDDDEVNELLREMNSDENGMVQLDKAVGVLMGK